MWTQRAYHKKSRARTHKSRNPHKNLVEIYILDIQSRFCYNKHIQIQSSSCMITNTHIISKRIMTINQIQTRNTLETHKISSSSHTHIMRNQITHIQIHHIIQCVHTHIQTRIRVTVRKLAKISQNLQKSEIFCIFLLCQHLLTESQPALCH